MTKEVLELMEDKKQYKIVDLKKYNVEKQMVESTVSRNRKLRKAI